MYHYTSILEVEKIIIVQFEKVYNISCAMMYVLVRAVARGYKFICIVPGTYIVWHRGCTVNVKSKSFQQQFKAFVGGWKTRLILCGTAHG